MDSRIGQVLLLAGVITPGKIEVALIDQQMQPDLRLGEILALRGWVDQDTVDYFAEMLPIMIKAESRLRLGEYFVCAGLLCEDQINELLAEQHETAIPLGQLAVRKGYLKQETIDFFLQVFALGSRSSDRAGHSAARHDDRHCLKVDSQLWHATVLAKVRAASESDVLNDVDLDDELDFDWLG